MVGRDLNQRTIQFGPRLAGCTSGLESRNDCACAIQLAAIRGKDIIYDRGMHSIDKAFGGITQTPCPSRVAFDATNIAPGIRAIDRNNACGDAFDDETLPAICEFDAVLSAFRSASLPVIHVITVWQADGINMSPFTTSEELRKRGLREGEPGIEPVNELETA